MRSKLSYRFRSASFNEPFVVRAITREDWQAYRDYYKGLSNPHHFSGILEGKDLDARQTYDTLFDQTIDSGTMPMFGLWHGKRLVGQTSISFLDMDEGRVALFAGSELADSYRGQGLAKQLYDARFNYLREIGFDGQVRTTIKPENHKSQKAALRNGFKNTLQKDKYGYFIFDLDPSRLHPKHNTQPKVAAPTLHNKFP